jgi:hypothetical protein
MLTRTFMLHLYWITSDYAVEDSSSISCKNHIWIRTKGRAGWLYDLALFRN